MTASTAASARRATLFIGGVEVRLSPQVLMTPNVGVTRYDRSAAGLRPATDLYWRLTPFLDFE
ncbi:MAG: hypothetical protein OEW68_15085 [Gammaproteobacteria bacterium]|nr:hypothetical protein [Gammaproteobacteria bacterium]MDH4316151.1 hypothetical protein [Gammaproteobacteria bacterium]MDH5215349.1 hypothetical protein [Gammaproteobacteria bacterium]